MQVVISFDNIFYLKSFRHQNMQTHMKIRFLVVYQIPLTNGGVHYFGRKLFRRLILVAEKDFFVAPFGDNILRRKVCPKSDFWAFFGKLFDTF